MELPESKKLHPIYNFQILLVLTLFSIFGLTSCTTKAKKDGSQTLAIDKKRNELEKELEFADSLFDRGEYAKAADIYSDFHRSHSGTAYDVPVLFNWAMSLEQLRQCSKALELYRSVLRLTVGKVKTVEAQTYFRMSYVYECLGDDPKLIASLHDALKRKANLQEEVSLVELPARLALAYSRRGNLKVSKQYLDLAEQGILTLEKKTRNQTEKKSLLARALYTMGTVTEKEKEKASDFSYIDSLKFMQPYLYKSVELLADTWSELAQKEILSAYDRMFKKIQDAKLGAEDSTIAELSEKKLMQLRSELAQKLLANIEDLRGYRLAQTNEPVLIANLFSELKSREKQLRSFMAKNIFVTPLTKEAKKNQGIKRQGRVVSPPTELEKNATGQRRSR